MGVNLSSLGLIAESEEVKVKHRGHTIKANVKAPPWRTGYKMLIQEQRCQKEDSVRKTA